MDRASLAAALTVLLLLGPGLAAAAPAEPEPTEATPAPVPTLDLSLRYDATRSREESAFGAVKVSAKLESTLISMDGEHIGTGHALRARVVPGLHVLEARLPSGRQLSASILVRPGQIVEYEITMGSKKGEDAAIVLTNVAAIIASIVLGNVLAIQGNTPVPTDMPGLSTGLDTMKAGNRQLQRP